MNTSRRLDPLDAPEVIEIDLRTLNADSALRNLPDLFASRLQSAAFAEPCDNSPEAIKRRLGQVAAAEMSHNMG
jgi:hypothetical protein